MRILLVGVVVLLMLFGVGCGGENSEKDTSRESPQETTQQKAVTVEETTAPRERTEVTTGFEFSVGKTPMDEEEDDDKVATRREVVVEREGKSSSDTQEEQYPPESDPSESDPPVVECRFFSQSEWVQADAEQKAFIQECDRAAGRAAPSPSAKEADAKEAPQERATQPEPQPQPAAPPDPQPEASPAGGDVNCGDFNPPSAAQPYLLPGDPYDLDRDNDGLACE